VDRLEKEIESARRLRQSVCAMAIPVGHDDHLSWISKIQDLLFRKKDYVFSYKNEFVVVIVEADKDEMNHVRNRVTTICASAKNAKMALYPDDGITAHELLNYITQK